MLAKLHKDPESVERIRQIMKEDFPDTDLSCMIPEEDVLEGGFYPEYQGCCFYETRDLKYEDEFFRHSQMQKLYDSGMPFSEIIEKHQDLFKDEYGVADNFDQIREYLKEEIEDPDNFYAIKVGRVDQDKSNAGKGGGWRWHKWGKYIGDLDPEYEYLDDEEFGDDWQGYVLTFHIVRIHPEDFPDLK